MGELYYENATGSMFRSKSVEEIRKRMGEIAKNSEESLQAEGYLSGKTVQELCFDEFYKPYSGNVVTVVGSYINVYSIGVDVYVILNEPNDQPRSHEVGVISETIGKLLNDKTETITENKVYEALDKLELKCLKFGFSVNIIIR